MATQVNYSVEQGATLQAQLTFTLPISSALAWSAATAYVPGNVILAPNGNYYQCILANTNQSPPNATYWSQYTSPTMPVDLTGAWLRSTAKTNLNLPDSDPTTVKVDWQETTTAAYGTTNFTYLDTVTRNMAPGTFLYELRLIGALNLPTVVVVQGGAIQIIQPVSNRAS